MRQRKAARSGGDHRQCPPPLTFPPSFPHSTPFPHWISQNETIKVTNNNYRLDLTKAALSRLSAVNRNLKVAKSGAKKWNMQALKNNFEVDYGSKEHVTIVFAALDVDKELQPDKVKRQISISDGRLIVKILHGERMRRNQPYRFIKMLEYCSLWHYAKRMFVQVNSSITVYILWHYGLTHRKESAADCCQACLDQAKRAKPGEKKCNIWVYCPSEYGCYSPDIYENKHQECWLKQADKPQLNFKNKYSEPYRNTHPRAPIVIPWMSGVVGA